MTWIIGWMLVVAGMLDCGSGSDEKIFPVSVSLSEGGLGFRPPQQTYYQQPYPQNQFAGNNPYDPSDGYADDHQGPPNYGNSVGPGENSIAPAVNPFPKLTHCRNTGYTGCGSSQDCCSAGCDIFGPSKMCCIPEGQICDYSRPTHANHYACCWPLACDPYKKNTGITVCQETRDRFPGSSLRAGAGDRHSDRRGIWNNTIPWYSAENPLWDGE